MDRDRERGLVREGVSTETGERWRQGSSAECLYSAHLAIG